MAVLLTKYNALHKTGVSNRAGQTPHLTLQKSYPICTNYESGLGQSSGAAAALFVPY